jgi:hypothetical protein
MGQRLAAEGVLWYDTHYIFIASAQFLKMNMFKIRMMIFQLFLRLHTQNVREIINKIPPQLTAQSFLQFSVLAYVLFQDNRDS